MFDPGEKAGRLLGTSEPNSPGLRPKKSWKARQLKKYPSFMSITMPDIDGGSVEKYGNTAMPEMTAGQDMDRRPPQTLRNKPSSPLLGRHFVDGSALWGSVTDAPRPKAHRSESSSTLQSHYDPSKSPLAISQQTSASSARDMALRKGCKPIATPLRQDLPKVTAYPAAAVTRKTDDLIDPQERNIQPLDVSKLFPLPQPPNNGVSPEISIVKSPSQLSLASSSQQWISTNRVDWIGQGGSKQTDPAVVADKLDLKETLRMEGNNVKPNGKRLNKATKNWFDGLGDEGNEVIGALHGGSSALALPEDPRESVKIGIGEVSKDLRLRQRKSSLSDPRRRPSSSRPTLSFQLEPAVISTNDPRGGNLSQSSGPRSSEGSISRKSTPSHRQRVDLSAMDLVNQSVLLLSSSDEELNPPTPRRRARIRDSVEVADAGDEPLVYSAETMKASKPRPIVKIVTSRPSTPKRQVEVPPVPKVPETPHLYQRTPAKKWGADIKSKITSMKVVDHRDVKLKLASMQISDGPVYDAETSAASRTATKNLRSTPVRSDHVRSSKMMAVTEEEEKLLEAMRKKRASIRKIDFAEGYHKALQFHGNTEPETRPKTSNVDGRPEFFDLERTTSPSLLGHGLRSSLTGAPFAASTDDLVPAESYPFPETTQQWSRTINTIPPHDPSPSLSFSPSDILPSSPSSCLSPRTPPSGHGFLEVYAGGTGISPSRQLRFWDPNRHDRIQSVSSGVLTLSSGERKARDMDSEDGVAGWATERW